MDWNRQSEAFIGLWKAWAYDLALCCALQCSCVKFVRFRVWTHKKPKQCLTRSALYDTSSVVTVEICEHGRKDWRIDLVLSLDETERRRERLLTLHFSSLFVLVRQEPTDQDIHRRQTCSSVCEAPPLLAHSSVLRSGNIGLHYKSREACGGLKRARYDDGEVWPWLTGTKFLFLAGNVSENNHTCSATKHGPL